MTGLLLFNSRLAFGDLNYPAEIEWRMFSTEHFDIVFPQDGEFLAAKAAVIAEEVLPVLEERLKWKVKSRIQIVISDATDESNGNSTPFPMNKVNVFTHPPTSFDRLDYYDDWFRLLLTHELTHTVHLDATGGVPKVLRYTFGRAPIVFFNYVQPVFLVEGLATHEESDLTGYGRTHSSITDMIMYAASVEGPFPTIDAAAVYPDEYPAGNTPYLFGAMFYDYLSAKHGEESLGLYSQKHAGQLWPFRFNHNAKKIFGKRLDILWNEWRSYLQSYYRARYSDLEKKGFTKNIVLTDTGYDHSHLRYSSNGDYLYYIEHTNYSMPGIFRINLKTKVKERVISAQDPNGFDIGPDNTIVFSKREKYKVWNDFNDLYLLCPNSLLPHRLTHGSRLYDPAISPDEKYCIAVRAIFGRGELVRVDLKTGKEETLYISPPEDLFQFSNPSFSPDGQKLAVSAWHGSGNRDIFLFDLNDHSFRRLTSHPDRDIDPSFCKDGTVLFSSGRSGVYNIYKLDPAKNALHQITNMDFGAFYPMQSPDGRQIAIVRYGAKGFDVATLNDSDLIYESLTYEGSNEGLAPAVQTRRLLSNASNKKYSFHDFNPLYSLLPRYWLPTWNVSDLYWSIGGQTAGYDDLFRHNYSGQILYSPDLNTINWSLFYIYARFRPNILLSQYFTTIYYGNIAKDKNGIEKPYAQSDTGGSVGIVFPVTDKFSFFANWRGNYRKPIFRVPDSANPEDLPEAGFFSGIQAGIMADTTKSFTKSVSKDRGGEYYLAVTHDEPELGSYYIHGYAATKLRQYIPMFFTGHVLALRAGGGAAWGERLFFNTFHVGGWGSEEAFNTQADGLFMLRGYPSYYFSGEKTFAYGAEYRAPLWWIDKGYSTWPLYARYLAASAFFDSGAAWSKFLDREDIHTGAGAELYLSMYVAYYYEIKWRFALAYGFDRQYEGGLHYLITWGGSF